MRRILVDHARKRCAEKRGAGERPTQIDEGLVAVDRPGELVALDDALEELAGLDERRARVTEHYFGDLRLAEAWLRTRMRDPGS